MRKKHVLIVVMLLFVIVVLICSIFGQAVKEMSIDGITINYIVDIHYIIKHFPSFLISIGLLFLGLYMFIFCLFIWHNDKSVLLKGCALSFFTFIGGWYVFSDVFIGYISVIFKNATFCDIFDISPLLFILPSVFFYFYTNLNEFRNYRLMFYATIFCEIAAITMLLLAKFLTISMYKSQVIIVFAAVVAMSLSIGILVKEGINSKNKNAMFVIMSYSPIVISGILEILNYFGHFMPKRISFYVAIIATVFLQIYQLLRYSNYIIKKDRHIHMIEKELEDNKVAIMLSQIQPHFLSNCLNAIGYLCKNNPCKAEEAVDSFAAYLRGNLNSITVKGCIPFNDEVSHVKNYLALEKMRFDEKLNIIWNIKDTKFGLPPLTLQPIVENAVYHGLFPKQEGGSLCISSFDDDLNHIISVTDDGVGFELDEQKEKHAMDNKSHIGISNVEYRLKAICNGTLSIQSLKGLGTTAIIIIPKE